MTILTEKLYEQVLIDPAVKHGADTLYVVSGYASPHIVAKQFEDLEKKNINISINLTVGMVSAEGIDVLKHLSFKNLSGREYKGRFSCLYTKDTPPIHTKLYIWTKNSKPLLAYTGSANYTKNGFSYPNSGYKEILSPCDPIEAMDYWLSLKTNLINCLNPISNDYVTVIPHRKTFKKAATPTAISPASQWPEPGYTIEDVVNLSFLGKVKGKTIVPESSGLNWAHRKTGTRNNLNEAYIKVPSTVYHTDFFPPIGVFFQVKTDDGKFFTCVRAQQNGKCIETPEDNSLLGLYFRQRLNIPSGTLLTHKHLESYGRTDVTFRKIGDTHYEMDFSVSKK